MPKIVKITPHMTRPANMRDVMFKCTSHRLKVMQVIFGKIELKLNYGKVKLPL